MRSFQIYASKEVCFQNQKYSSFYALFAKALQKERKNILKTQDHETTKATYI